MLSIKKLTFYKTIRFKLTLVYSLITLSMIILLLAAMNIFLNNHLRQDPSQFRVPPRFNGPRAQQLEVLTNEELERIREVRLADLRQFRRASAISLLPLAALSFILGYLISGDFLRPINDLTHKLQHLQSNELGRTLPIKNNDEIGMLTASFNEMSQHLKLSFDDQLKFVQDASHELKTPLAIIHTSLDTTLSDKQASCKELRDAMQDALSGVRRLKKITNDLLTITTPYSLNESVDLRKIISEQVQALHLYAERKNVSVEIKLAEEPQMIKANQNYLATAFYNVIENGIKYSSSKHEARVRITQRVTSEEVITFISDNGPGIEEKIKEKIFKRFFRAQKSTEGNGLGLAISKEIIEHHRGTITLADHPETTFEIRLPFTKETSI